MKVAVKQEALIVSSTRATRTIPTLGRTRDRRQGCENQLAKVNVSPPRLMVREILRRGSREASNMTRPSVLVCLETFCGVMLPRPLGIITQSPFRHLGAGSSRRHIYPRVPAHRHAHRHGPIAPPPPPPPKEPPYPPPPPRHASYQKRNSIPGNFPDTVSDDDGDTHRASTPSMNMSPTTRRTVVEDPLVHFQRREADQRAREGTQKNGRHCSRISEICKPRTLLRLDLPITGHRQAMRPQKLASRRRLSRE